MLSPQHRPPMPDPQHPCVPPQQTWSSAWSGEAPSARLYAILLSLTRLAERAIRVAATRVVASLAAQVISLPSTDPLHWHNRDMSHSGQLGSVLLWKQPPWTTSWPAGQHWPLIHICGDATVSPQQSWSQQISSSQQGWSQHSPIAGAAERLLEAAVSPAQPLAAGEHPAPPHWVTRSAQTPLKQSTQTALAIPGAGTPLGLSPLWQTWLQQVEPATLQVRHSSPPVPHFSLVVPPEQRPGLPGPSMQQPSGMPSFGAVVASHWQSSAGRNDPLEHGATTPAAAVGADSPCPGTAAMQTHCPF